MLPLLGIEPQTPTMVYNCITIVLPMQQPGKYRCGCGVLISNVGKAEREHCKSDRHQWLKSQQITKILSAFFVKQQNPVGSSSSSSITNTSNNCNTNSSSSSNANSSSLQPW